MDSSYYDHMKPLIILVHSSKTMRSPPTRNIPANLPQLRHKTSKLETYLKTLSILDIASSMRISTPLAEKTYQLIQGFNTTPAQQRPAVDSFLGDVYSGLQSPKWTKSDRKYADDCLRIISGLYGVLRPLDGIYPYRLEMGYKLPHEPYNNLYTFWGDSIVKTLPEEGTIVNLLSEEYARVIKSYVTPSRLVSPKFLTANNKKGEPATVAVHSKVARGAFASWLVRNRTNNIDDLPAFDEIGYSYSKEASTTNVPVFICQEFGGKGLSLRLQ